MDHLALRVASAVSFVLHDILQRTWAEGVDYWLMSAELPIETLLKYQKNLHYFLHKTKSTLFFISSSHLNMVFEMYLRNLFGRPCPDHAPELQQEDGIEVSPLHGSPQLITHTSGR